MKQFMLFCSLLYRSGGAEVGGSFLFCLASTRASCCWETSFQDGFFIHLSDTLVFPGYSISTIASHPQLGLLSLYLLHGGQLITVRELKLTRCITGTVLYLHILLVKAVRHGAFSNSRR
jgi:hypothetical protein